MASTRLIYLSMKQWYLLSSISARLGQVQDLAWFSANMAKPRGALVEEGVVLGGDVGEEHGG